LEEEVFHVFSGGFPSATGMGWSPDTNLEIPEVSEAFGPEKKV